MAGMMDRKEQEEAFRRDLDLFVSPGVSLDQAVSTIASWAIGHVAEDVEDGTAPASCSSFSSLHDHVDANHYGNLFRWPCSLPSSSASPASPWAFTRPPRF